MLVQMEIDVQADTVLQSTEPSQTTAQSDHGISLVRPGQLTFTRNVGTTPLALID